MFDLYDGKLSRTVLRRESGSNARDLSGKKKGNYMFNFLKKTTKQKVHFLHIGKTGGSAIKSVLEKKLITPKYILKLHSHGTSLKDIPKGEYVVFFWEIQFQDL